MIEEVLHVNNRDIKYYQTEGAFSQPNAKVCELMIDWALDCTKDSHHSDLLELYCGGGTFTAPLAANFKQVLATEMSKVSVQLATRCFEMNNITNIKIARLSSEDFTAAYNGVRTFQRLKDSGINIKSYNFSTVLVDPPRSGLDSATCALLAQFPNIIYISCNPTTLARDLQVLTKSHSVLRCAAFDQFPYTDHLESGVHLVLKSSVLKAAVQDEPVAVAVAVAASELGKRSFEDMAPTPGQDPSAAAFDPDTTPGL